MIFNHFTNSCYCEALNLFHFTDRKEKNQINKTMGDTNKK